MREQETLDVESTLFLLLRACHGVDPMSDKPSPLTPALEQAFRDAVIECKHWIRDPDREPEVYVGYDDCAKISAVCEYVLACQNKPMPKLTLYPLYDIPDHARRDLKELLNRDESYHTGAHCLQVLIKRKRRTLEKLTSHQRLEEGG